MLEGYGNVSDNLGTLRIKMLKSNFLQHGITVRINSL